MKPGTGAWVATGLTGPEAEVLAVVMNERFATKLEVLVLPTGPPGEFGLGLASGSAPVATAEGWGAALFAVTVLDQLLAE